MTWVAVGGAVISLVGGIAGNNAEAKKRKGIRRLNAINADRLEKQATLVESQTADEQNLLRQQLTRVVGEQRAGYGASGVSGDSGSALDVLAESITSGLNDRRRRAEAGRLQAEDLRYQGKIGNLQASALVSSSNAAGQADLLSGIGGAVSRIRTSPTTKPGVK